MLSLRSFPKPALAGTQHTLDPQASPSSKLPAIGTQAMPAVMSLLSLDPSASALCAALALSPTRCSASPDTPSLFCILNSRQTVLDSNHTHNARYTVGRTRRGGTSDISTMATLISRHQLEEDDWTCPLVCAPEFLLLRQRTNTAEERWKKPGQAKCSECTSRNWKAQQPNA